MTFIVDALGAINLLNSIEISWKDFSSWAIGANGSESSGDVSDRSSDSSLTR